MEEKDATGIKPNDGNVQAPDQDPEREDWTGTIDLGVLLREEVTASGSYDLRDVETTTLGRLLHALPIPALLTEGSGRIIFANLACRRIHPHSPDLPGQPFSTLFPVDSEATNVLPLIKQALTSAELPTREAVVGMGNDRTWCRLSFRSLRIRGEKCVLVLVEDLSAEKERLSQVTSERKRLSDVRDVTGQKKKEDTILRAKQELEQTFDAVPDMIAIIDSDLRLRRVNWPLARRLGTTPQQIVGEPCYRVIHDKDEPPPVCLCRKSLTDGERRSAEYFDERLDATLEVSVSPVLQADGKVWGAVYIARDVTERKTAEAKIRRQNEFLNEVLESLTHPFYVIDAEDYSVSMANSAARLGELTPTSTCYSLTHRRDEPCSGEEHPCPLQAVRKSRRPVRVEHIHYDQDGIPRNVEVFGYPLLDRSGKVARLIEYCIDITKSKEAENALRESEERFRTLFETAPEYIFIKDRDLRYTHVNPAMTELLGIPAVKLIGLRDKDIFGEWTASHLEEIETRVLRGEHVEAENTRSVNGVLMTFDDMRVPLRSSEGEVVGLYGIARNVSDLKPMTSSLLPETAEKTASTTMRSTLIMAEVAAEKGGIILLLGESGSGKDYLARYIHDHSPRRDGPFFAVNCAALPPDLAESELFGHERGAFTGAISRKRGLLELAEGGTLLLNEIGELSLGLQAKLLAFLDHHSFTRVGGETTIPVHARILAATNRDLEREVSERRFREDLYYRINVLSLRVPPLRERKEDIPGLVHSLLEELASEMHLQQTPHIDEQAMNVLVSYRWPGNVRELRNVLERGLMLGPDGGIDLGSVALESDHEGWSHTVRFPVTGGLQELIDEVKRAVVVEALHRSRGTKSTAAAYLGISRYALFRLIKSLGLDVR